jgi:hypothetical protein
MQENYQNITNRDKELLNLLISNKRRLLRRDQIQRLYTGFASTDRLNKRLKMLFQKHIIDRIYPTLGPGQGSSKQYICLDRGGYGIIGIEKYNKPIFLDSQGNRCLFSGWRHKVELNECECQLLELMKNIDGSILYYEVEESYEYHNIEGETKKIIPDIICILKVQGKGFLLAIEVDMGTEDIPSIKSKIDAYKHWHLSKTWVTTSWSKKFKNPVFPRMVFITDDNIRRIKTINDYMKDGSIRYKVGYREMFTDLIKEIIKG